MMLIDQDYARIYTKLRIKGWQYGWAVVLHGSCTRDLDLLMTPWEERAHFRTAEQCIIMLAADEKLKLSTGAMPAFLDAERTNIDWTQKPHGRKAVSLHFPGFGDPRWVDISVTPALNREGQPK